jgi:pimeloyl-ACP methyl ester carboxylesterase
VKSTLNSNQPAQSPLETWLEEQWAITPRSFAVEVEGVPITCLGWNLEARERPGLILVHGFRAHAHWWDHIAPSLAQDFRVVALDLSGMGDSGHRTRYTRAQHGREIVAVSAACGFERPVIVAHSYGGIVALTSARDHSGTYSRLTIIDSAIPTPADRERRVPETRQRLYPSRDAALARFRLAPAGQWPVGPVVDHIARHSVRETPQGWTWKFDPNAIVSLNDERTRSSALGEVHLPSNFIYGAESEIVTPARLAMLPSVMPTVAQPIVIPLSHHHIMIEQPLALVAALRAILAGDAAMPAGVHR